MGLDASIQARASETVVRTGQSANRGRSLEATRNDDPAASYFCGTVVRLPRGVTDSSLATPANAKVQASMMAKERACKRLRRELVSLQAEREELGRSVERNLRSTAFLSPMYALWIALASSALVFALLAVGRGELAGPRVAVWLLVGVLVHLGRNNRSRRAHEHASWLEEIDRKTARTSRRIRALENERAGPADT